MSYATSPSEFFSRLSSSQSTEQDGKAKAVFPSPRRLPPLKRFQTPEDNSLLVPSSSQAQTPLNHFVSSQFLVLVNSCQTLAFSSLFFPSLACPLSTTRYSFSRMTLVSESSSYFLPPRKVTVFWSDPPFFLFVDSRPYGFST